MKAAGLAMLCALMAAASPARADIGAGNWEMEITTSISGLPGGGTQATGPVKQTQCLRAEDARDPARLFGNPAGGCDFTNRRDDGSTFRFDISCSGQAPLSGNGEVRYARDTLEGEVAVRVGAGSQAIETRSRIRARRVGPCS